MGFKAPTQTSSSASSSSSAPVSNRFRPFTLLRRMVSLMGVTAKRKVGVAPEAFQKVDKRSLSSSSSSTKGSVSVESMEDEEESTSGSETTTGSAAQS